MTPVSTRFFELASESVPFYLQSGEALAPAVLAYETYGTLNAKKSNAVLVFHALSGSQHAAGFNPSVPGVGERWTEEVHEGWWDAFIGPGRGLDTDSFFVICANFLGGCYGSTGPGSVDPRTGRPYGPRFPQLTMADIVDSQLALLDHLGIEVLHAVVGASLGGVLALSLATRWPERVRIVIPFATGIRTTPLQRLLNLEQICAIEADPNFHGGDYYSGTAPDRGLALARMIGHKTFVSLAAMEERARTEIVRRDDSLAWYQLRSPLESYMLHQGRKFVRRFDANTYLRILDAWNRFDLVREAVASDMVALFRRCRNQEYLIFTIDSDACYFPEEQAYLAEVLKKADVNATRITVHSDKGHDSFLLEAHLYRPFLRAALSSPSSPPPFS
ncbi:MAG: homoserine O-acetyltransferase [Verrucomicrobiales bacterium]|nr:homoserine O-acetyltransferase [Verrucomicrobiales bacterium]